MPDDEIIEAVSRIDGGAAMTISLVGQLRLMLPPSPRAAAAASSGSGTAPAPARGAASGDLLPLALGLYGMLIQTADSPTSSLVRRRGLLAMVPLAILFLSLQRFWRIDLIFGGVKG